MPDTSFLGAEELRAVAGRHAASIIEISMKSRNLKETMVRGLRVAPNNLLEVVSALASRAEPEEISRVRAHNARLRREVDALRASMGTKEFAEMKASAAKAAVQMPTLEADSLEELKSAIISSVGVLN